MNLPKPIYRTVSLRYTIQSRLTNDLRLTVHAACAELLPSDETDKLRPHYRWSRNGPDWAGTSEEGRRVLHARSADRLAASSVGMVDFCLLGHPAFSR